MSLREIVEIEKFERKIKGFVGVEGGKKYSFLWIAWSEYNLDSTIREQK